MAVAADAPAGILRASPYDYAYAAVYAYAPGVHQLSRNVEDIVRLQEGRIFCKRWKTIHTHIHVDITLVVY